MLESPPPQRQEPQKANLLLVVPGAAPWFPLPTLAPRPREALAVPHPPPPPYQEPPLWGPRQHDVRCKRFSELRCPTARCPGSRASGPNRRCRSRGRGNNWSPNTARTANPSVPWSADEQGHQSTARVGGTCCRPILWRDADHAPLPRPYRWRTPTLTCGATR